jgi:hypothetical protein
MSDFLQGTIVWLALGFLLVVWPRLAHQASTVLRRVAEGIPSARVWLLGLLALLGGITGILISPF